MPFGKDRNGLGNVAPFGANTSFSQRAAFFREQQNSQRQRTGGGGGMFADRFKPTTDPNKFDEGRLIKGDYEFTGCDKDRNIYTYKLEYWPYTEHFDGRNEKSTYCSAGIFKNFKDHRDPCSGCDLFWETREKGPGGRGKSRVSNQDKYAFNFLHYNPYHKTPQIDRQTGQIRTNPENGEAYTEWTACQGRLCPFCPQKLETIPARTLKWEMGYSHFAALTTNYQNAIGNTCKSCGAKDSIYTLAYTCSNSICGEAIIDMADTTLRDEDIFKIKNAPVLCAHCKQEGWLNEVFKCNGCNAPQRCDIFDVDIKIQRAPTGKGDGNATNLIVSSWSSPGPIDPRFTSLIKTYDMPKIYAPTALDVQARLFGLSAPAAGGPVSRTPVNSGFKQYAGQQQGGSQLHQTSAPSEPDFKS